MGGYFRRARRTGKDKRFCGPKSKPGGMFFLKAAFLRYSARAEGLTAAKASL